jgi:hypothetical protein
MQLGHAERFDEQTRAQLTQGGRMRFWVLCLAGVFGCAAPLVLRSVSQTSHAIVPAPAGEADSAAVDSVTVQLRYFASSPGVSVVAWLASEPHYGLRAWIRRDGTLIRDHQLYVSTSFHPRGAFPRAAVGGRSLLMSGVGQDDFACAFPGGCTPLQTFGARLPDQLLRAVRDSIQVRFYSLDGVHIDIALQHWLTDAYLSTVDSVITELRRGRAPTDGR